MDSHSCRSLRVYFAGDQVFFTVWTENALSDLGVQESFTATLFNYGLIISGIMTLVFASGLLALLHKKTFGKVGSFTFMFATLALIAIGAFPENARPMHYLASVLLFCTGSSCFACSSVDFCAGRQSENSLVHVVDSRVAAFP